MTNASQEVIRTVPSIFATGVLFKISKEIKKERKKIKKFAKKKSKQKTDLKKVMY